MSSVRSVEPFGVPEIYFSGVGAVTQIDGGVIWLSLYRNFMVGSALEQRTVAHLIGPIEGIPRAVQQILTVTGEAHARLGGCTITANAEEPVVLTPKEYFVTDMTIQCEPEFVRLTFFSDRSAVSLVIPPGGFDRIASQIAMGPDRPLH